MFGHNGTAMGRRCYLYTVDSGTCRRQQARQSFCAGNNKSYNDIGKIFDVRAWFVGWHLRGVQFHTRPSRIMLKDKIDREVRSKATGELFQDHGCNNILSIFLCSEHSLAGLAGDLFWALQAVGVCFRPDKRSGLGRGRRCANAVSAIWGGGCVDRGGPRC